MSFTSGHKRIVNMNASLIFYFTFIHCDDWWDWYVHDAPSHGLVTLRMVNWLLLKGFEPKATKNYLQRKPSLSTVTSFTRGCKRTINMTKELCTANILLHFYRLWWLTCTRCTGASSTYNGKLTITKVLNQKLMKTTCNENFSTVVTSFTYGCKRTIKHDRWVMYRLYSASLLYIVNWHRCDVLV
jgi:hypothetical protein